MARCVRWFRRSLPAGVALAGLLLCGCPGSERAPLDSKVVLGLSQGDDGILVVAHTEREYSCLGFEIGTRTRKAEDRTTIEFTSVVLPNDPCATALGPARAAVDLGPLTPGDYLLRLVANGYPTTAHLRVTADSLVVAGGDGPWTVWPERGWARPASK